MATIKPTVETALGLFIWAVAYGIGAGLASGATPPGTGPAPEWRYVEPGPGVPSDGPGFRTLPLSDRKPADLVEEGVDPEAKRRYGQLRYGSPDSVRAAVVIVSSGAGRPSLYVDRDRDRRIEPSERVEGVGTEWRVPLDVEWRDGPLRAPEYLRRGVVLRLSRSGRTLTYATAGHLEGILQVGDRAVPARRVDGDGNGRFADPDDLLRLDLDGDGRFDPFAEQFAIGPILAVSGKSYALDTDRRGERFSLAPLTGTGTVEWRVSPAGQRVGVREFRALLIGRDGAVIALAGAEGRATAPVGEYRLDSLALTLSDPAGGEPWNYTFSTSGTPSTPAWHRLTAGSSVVIEPLRGLRMGVDLPGGRGTRPGDLISAVPTLTTADSLVINSCYRGAPGGFGGEDGPAAEIALIEGAGRTLATARSGFA